MFGKEKRFSRGEEVAVATVLSVGRALALLLFLTPTSIGLASSSTTEIEEAILRGLIHGQNVSALSEQYLPKGTYPQFPHDHLSRVGIELASALEDLKETLVAPKSGSEQVEEAVTAAIAAHEAVLAHFTSVAERLDDLGDRDELGFRLDQARAAYQAKMAPILSAAEGDAYKSTSSQALVESIESLLAQPTAPILRSGLPYDSQSLASRSPAVEPTIIPSYSDPDATGSDARDLAGTVDAPLHAGILQLAEDLEHNATRIRELVRNQIKTEWYAGSQKGYRMLATLECRVVTDRCITPTSNRC